VAEARAGGLLIPRLRIQPKRKKYEQYAVVHRGGPILGAGEGGLPAPRWSLANLKQKRERFGGVG